MIPERAAIITTRLRARTASVSRPYGPSTSTRVPVDMSIQRRLPSAGRIVTPPRRSAVGSADTDNGCPASHPRLARDMAAGGRATRRGAAGGESVGDVAVVGPPTGSSTTRTEAATPVSAATTCSACRVRVRSAFGGATVVDQLEREPAPLAGQAFRVERGCAPLGRGRRRRRRHASHVLPRRSV